jgi:Ca-activated chloride channel homolog
MTMRIVPMTRAEVDAIAEVDTIAETGVEAGLGSMLTSRGNLPLDRIDLRADIVGLTSHIELTQEFVNVHSEPLEATYIFPLPDRAAVTAARMIAADRTIEAELQERSAARATYDRAIAAGQRASIAEEERPDVFTMRVGNILGGERVTVTLTLAGALPVEDGEATFRFPLVVAPRYIPGAPLSGESVGDGHAVDTDAVPDASRITPPVLLPNFPSPVRLSIDVGLEPAGLPFGEVRSSLHAVTFGEGRIRIDPGERPNRDFVLRMALGASTEAAGLIVVPDAEGDEGTYQLTVVPPAGSTPGRPRDLVLLLDRSGSMQGWKMVAARRAAARIVDTLTGSDRFAVLAFDHQIEAPERLPSGLVEASDRNRYRAVEHLARMDARGGTELLAPLRKAGALLSESGSDRDPVVVLVTDGQVGNEDQILRESGGQLRGVRVHTVGIDQAVNAGFLGRLAGLGGGRCELVESEDRLDDAMERIHRRIGSPLVTGVTVTAEGFTPLADTQAPARLPDIFPGVPYLIRGRYAGARDGSLTLTGNRPDGTAWSVTAAARCERAPALRAIWARATLRDLEDAYATTDGGAASARRSELESRIVRTSLRFGVLCRFTAYVAVDSRVVTDGSAPRAIVQPVESPAGWEMAGGGGAPLPPPNFAAQAMFAPPGASAGPVARPAMMPMSAAMPRSAAPTRATRLTSAGEVTGAVPLPVPAPAPAPAPKGASRADAVPDELRALAATEAGRLRAIEHEPWYRRRELLEDIGSRLAALTMDTAAGTAPLRDLAALLSAERLDAHRDDDSRAELWRHVLDVLDSFAAGAGAGFAAGPGAVGGPGGEGPGKTRGRGAFWKR